jgi:hypothetical protein
MKALLLIPLLAVFSKSVGAPQITTLSFDARALKEAFNAAADKPRLVGVFSPTCSHCLLACSELQQILNRHPDTDLTVFLLWGPYMRHRDSLASASRATDYLPDKRVQHFWDLWRFAGRNYSEQLKVPKEHAWDMFVFYKPQLVWQASSPEPTFWMQNRNLKVGAPYSEEDLEKRLKEWSR